MYREMGILPRDRGSSMSGCLVPMYCIMLSKPPPTLIMPPIKMHMPTIMAMAQQASVTATPLKPPMVV